ncbi:nuclear transcription factor Y subunit beta-like [Aedes aegypti]|uniref:Uncharacterized protein n=1 Tax=Aedes aegypti TaxID=7159 RepID=A0A6I8TWI7_AEDAE|nr:nuclear transcription factor Y subunit beta-like [Aedes aegypti]
MFSPPGSDRPGSVPPVNGLQQNPAAPNHQPGVNFHQQQPPSIPNMNPPLLQPSGAQAASHVPQAQQQQSQQNYSSVDPMMLHFFQQMQQQINLQFQQQQALLNQQVDMFRSALSAININPSGAQAASHVPQAQQQQSQQNYSSVDPMMLHFFQQMQQQINLQFQQQQALLNQQVDMFRSALSAININGDPPVLDSTQHVPDKV